MISAFLQGCVSSFGPLARNVACKCVARDTAVILYADHIGMDVFAVARPGLLDTLILWALALCGPNGGVVSVATAGLLNVQRQSWRLRCRL